MSHTPGPWKIGYSDGSGASDGIYITNASNEAIVRGGNPDGYLCHGVLRPCDARLIAAAPDLLKALKLFMDMWNSGDARRSSRRAQKRRADMWDKANAAVAKAEAPQTATEVSQAHAGRNAAGIRGGEPTK